MCATLHECAYLCLFVSLVVQYIILEFILCDESYIDHNIIYLGWLLYEVHATANTLKTVGQVRIIRHGVKYIHIDETITKGLRLGNQGYLEHHVGRWRLSSWLQRFRYRLAQRLLHLAQTEDWQWRTVAVHHLARLHHLSEADRIQLAQACDCHTAVGLARSRDTRDGFFLPPPLYKTTDNEKQSNYLMDAEVMLTEPWTILTSQDNLLPLCVQALDHHISTLCNETYLVELGGLPLLMSIYQQYKNNSSVCKMICRILARICSHQEFLPQVFSSGWIGVLAMWLESEDQHLSLLAGQSLANLDRDDMTQAHYGRHVVPLYPTYRAHQPLVDVVFVHGLLGSVLSTWRQRDSTHSAILGLQKEDIMEDTCRRRRHSSDEHTEEYLTTMTELTDSEWDQIGSDFEFVFTDFPLHCKTQSCQQFTLSGNDSRVRQQGNDKSYTLCWPKDWLPQDCPSIRVLGVDYESRLSDWFPTCSEKLRVKSLEEKSAIVLDQLMRCGIGQRPTVWVAHSMGGLLVKKILTEALSSCDYEARRIALNTRAVVFLSTPHFGCPLAKINDVLGYLLLPSTEVEELRNNTRILTDLHERFNDLLQEVNVKIVTFTETKSTRIATLGMDLHIVPPEFSYFEVGDLFEMPCDHACVAKPRNRLSFIYQTVLNLIKSVQEEETVALPCSRRDSKDSIE
ncbi:protein SERAC1 isoform X3 [Homalodisca vitripennis]|uniref:protein SERAC1 isoform X3 n=1 Tax=Homalodisca vitripennis TaxID=197043 RepID=UPI001EEAD09B|nr:protein SERAC1 isoform X3 [Homalodisca vitripennis]